MDLPVWEVEVDLLVWKVPKNRIFSNSFPQEELGGRVVDAARSAAG